MRLKLIINELVDGEDKDYICSIIKDNKLEMSFRQRKQYYEYYFTETWIDITENQLLELSNLFKLILHGDSLYIEFY